MKFLIKSGLSFVLGQLLPLVLDPAVAANANMVLRALLVERGPKEQRGRLGDATAAEVTSDFHLPRYLMVPHFLALGLGGAADVWKALVWEVSHFGALVIGEIPSPSFKELVIALDHLAFA